ncbi:hypothetical protein RFI_14504 [Reticulomyxa filosa]|uniref:Uncharacterized protein n=1 Tax=Reticulomyxa filosa TaxID=46433 RepID=X6N8R7_RETFI|nr:hypothetical protein RFI_14504 [Reticulomyxa filosa]|eukprot:ETO22690.1 hypothetical protein RFI_14504 [Reticulomyxa filosa]
MFQRGLITTKKYLSRPRRFSLSRFISTESRSNFPAKPRFQFGTLFLGLFGGVAVSALLNWEIPGYEKYLQKRAFGKGSKKNAEAKVIYAVRLLEQSRGHPQPWDVYDIEIEEEHQNECILPECIQTIDRREKSQMHRHLTQMNQRTLKDHKKKKIKKIIHFGLSITNTSNHYHLGIMHLLHEIQNPNANAVFYHLKFFVDNFGTNLPILDKKYYQDLLDDAKFQLAMCYLNGYGVDTNANQGMDILEKNLFKKNKNAAFELYKIFREGRYGQSVQPTLSLAWLRESAQLGHIFAMHEFHQYCVMKGKELIEANVPHLATLYVKET